MSFRKKMQRLVILPLVLLLISLNVAPALAETANVKEPAEEAPAAIAAPVEDNTYNIETIDGVGGNKDFVVGPGKVELTLEPGKKTVTNLYVTNRTGENTKFQLDVQDFKGSRDTQSTVVLLGDDRGPYSLKDFIQVGSKEFELKNGQRATIPVTVAVPYGTEPGGRYGSVVIRALPKGNAQGTGSVSGTNALVFEIGTLFFVKVPGPAKEDGILRDFSVVNDSSKDASNSMKFRLLFENNGNIYLNPFGDIQIKNVFGQEVATMKVSPWYSLPDSLRLREVEWNSRGFLGKYTATARINRGYGDIIDEQTISFWVLPLSTVLPVLILVLVVVSIFRWIFANFTLRRRQK